MSFNPTDLLAIAPEIVLLSLAAIVLLAELFITRSPAGLQSVTVIGLLAAAVVAVVTSGVDGGAFNGMVARDGFAGFLKIVLTGVALLTALISGDYWRNSALRHGEFYALLLMTTVGMMALATATDLVVLFIGVETMSIGLYLLASLRPERPRSSESGLKYLLLGAFASGFLLFGIALLYGSTGGNTNFNQISTAISMLPVEKPVTLYVGLGLLLVGLLFKIAAAPFHFWSPDVYQGAPTPVTAFMSAGPKAAAVAVTIRLMGWALPGIADAWQPVLWIVAAATMIVGNIVAISQTDIKRMLAYSSISHAGYLLLAILASGNGDVRSAAVSGMLFYLAVYYLMNMGAFTVAILVNRGREGGDYQLSDYQGLAGQKPWLALGMTVFLVSLAGIPPTAGFFGKLFVFTAAVKAGYIWLVVIAVLNSVVSAFYYLRPVVFMYMKPQTTPLQSTRAAAPAIVIGFCALVIVALGLMPGAVRNFADRGGNNVVTPIPTVEALGGTAAEAPQLAENR
jgi:NADH-quinone oxidoreductase subunit N